MSLNRQRAKEKLENFEFQKLFVEELGWNNPGSRQALPVQVEGQSFTLQPVAKKAELVVLSCTMPALPDRATRRKLDREVARLHYEHLIVFSDAAKKVQIWQWVRREPGKPEACRDYTFYKNNVSSAEGLLQKLEAIAFSLEEEEQLNTVAVAGRVKKSFDVETVTKKFYERFDKERKAFLGFIQGMENQASREWYASLMLNRLMFVYFIQKKGFLASDADYLRNRLKLVQARQGKGKFHTFYREFLLVLFHHGLGAQKRDPQLLQLLGQVPYLNGGLFDVHELERTNTAIEIPDEAFEGVFNFFDAYQWHLDERPLRRNDEINPDVLGYIFEKYINQKQMGAYYTKEDITEYISKNTILPYLFDKAQDDCEIAFKPDGTVWRLLQADPDRYIYPAVKKGLELPLPAEIEAGVNNVSRREGWNRAAPEKYALPTEIWREVVARRKRYSEVKTKLAAGEITSINDLITYNLDIRQFAQDVIENSEGSNLLEAFYTAITRVTVLDPTCGSGAFLFAALNILEPLYEACLERMQDFIDEADAGKPNPTKYASFRKTLQEVARHPNRRYFIYRSIILQNLYGVDIMEEAVEIAKLRLFLKLAAQVECDQSKPNFGLEPLPDIDFNIQAGNTLVGFATQTEAEAAFSLKLDTAQTSRLIIDIRHKAEEIKIQFDAFIQFQGAIDDEDAKKLAKQQLVDRLNLLNEQLNIYLAQQYGKVKADYNSPQDYEKAFKQWRESHQPFHWWVEFYRIMQNGGFDVVIGNPPYVEYSKVRNNYTIRGYKTEDCGNLYAYIAERSFAILQGKGRIGLIIPISSFATDRMNILKSLCVSTCTSLWVSSFGIRPSKLFEGAEQRLSILIGASSYTATPVSYSTKYQRWYGEERPFLLSKLVYQNITEFLPRFGYPKLSISVERTALAKMPKQKLESYFREKSLIYLYWHRIPAYFIKAVDFIPYFYSDRDGEKKSEDYKIFNVESDLHKNLILALLNSTTFYWFWFSISEGYHCGKHEVLEFPIHFESFSSSSKAELAKYASDLMADLKRNSQRRSRNQRTTNVIYDEFYPSHSKPIMDKIDQILAQHYGFTDEELDFIINYDIKYRMGRDSESEGEE